MYKSLDIELKVKEAAMEKLSQIKSDLLILTKAYCRAALPDKENKRKIWDGLFGKEFDEVSLLEHQSLCSGLIHLSHKEFTDGFEDEFFLKIEDCVKNKSRSNADNIFHGLQPCLQTEDVDIKRFEDFLAKIKSQESGESTNRLTKWL